MVTNALGVIETGDEVKDFIRYNFDIPELYVSYIESFEQIPTNYLHHDKSGGHARYYDIYFSGLISMVDFLSYIEYEEDPTIRVLYEDEYQYAADNLSHNFEAYDYLVSSKLYEVLIEEGYEVLDTSLTKKVNSLSEAVW